MIPYPYGPHPAQVAELHLPRAAAGPRAAAPPRAIPIAIMIHGGYWRARYDRSLQHPVAGDLVARGWAVWNVDYRAVGVGQSDGGGWPATFADVATGVDLLAGAAREHGLDGPVAVVGHSAGGALALWVAGRHRLPPGAVGSSPRVRPGAVVAQAAVCDLVGGLEQNLGAGAILDLMGVSAEQEPDRYRLASPQGLLPLGVPMLLVTDPADDSVPVGQSLGFADAARAAGDDIRLELIEHEGHFAHLDPGSRCWMTAAGWLHAWSAAQP